MTGAIENIVKVLAESQQQLLANARAEIDKLTDPAQKAYFADVLAQAEKGNFNAESFINDAKKFQ